MGLSAKVCRGNCGSPCRLVAALVALAAWSVVGAAPIQDLTAEQPTDFGLEDALLCLHTYGYLNDSHINANEGSFKEALKMYQEFTSLPITGTLDAATKQMMQVARCGMKDINPQGHEGGRQKRYAFMGHKFSKLHLTYRLLNAPPPRSSLTMRQAEAALERATAMWSSVSSLTFSRAGRGVPADIEISFKPTFHPPCRASFDGPPGHVAHALPPTFGRAEIHFYADKNWTPDNQGENFLQVAVHELGHALGLSHSKEPHAVMSVTPQNFILHSDDIEGIRALYGHSSEWTQDEDEDEDINGYGNGYVYRNGYGNGYVYGNGFGNGYVYGNGYENGYGNGYENGYGNGYENGYGNGYIIRYVYGNGYGNGYDYECE